MRSKTLSSELTIFKKDLTRFAPVWQGLCAWLTIWAISMLDQGQAYGSSNFYEPVAPVFAPILAIVVFGYLCDPRECHMVHSLPIRRERLFFIHVLSASVMFLVPVAVFCFLTRNIAVQYAMYRFLFSAIEFFLLFSIGVLCVMLTGRRIGAALLYIFVQLFNTVVYTIIQNLYMPQLPGLIQGNTFLYKTPTVIVATYADFMRASHMTLFDWTFIVRLALISLALLGISMLLYRKRKLEHAGDLLAVRWLEPFFAVCAGMTGGAAMRVFIYEVGIAGYLLGAMMGYLAYWMLLKKTARVFTPKILGGLACLLAVILGSVYLVSLDPLDRVSYVPEVEDVEKAVITGHYLGSDDYETTDPAVIAEIEQLHLDTLDHYIEIGGTDVADYDGESIFFSYVLKDGSTIQRRYLCKSRDLLDRAGWYLSQPVALFGRDDPNFTFVQVHHNMEHTYFDPDLTGEFVELLLEECRNGEMYSFEYDSRWHIQLTDTSSNAVFSIDVPSGATRVINWLSTNCHQGT